ncbi:MAG: DUF2723 domain-containing protein [Candidatus Cryptobacteroides sp.]
MNNKKFRLWNRIVAAVVTVIAAFTYLSTIEPSASFWDCGEFIASSYKLEVGHPPGNPVFQLIARFFTMFADGSHAAIAVNAMSALCSALTIFLLYLTIVFFAKRLAGKPENGEYTVGQAITIFGSAAVGALAYCFSDTFWFSAVEGEVYAMSSLFTALVVWAMTKWYEQADEPYANRWIILISFLMGLSIGVHLLNLLAIPVLVFLFYYRRREDGHYTFKEYLKIMLIAIAILGALVFVIIPYLPKVAAYVDLFFVNSLGLPYNSGAAFFMLALIGILFYGAFRTYRKGKVVLNTIILSLTTIVIGFSVFAVVIIRSNVMPPTNEYQPDNAFTLVRYLSREQYGSTPLLYGQYYGAPYSLSNSKYWAPLNGKYKHVDSPADPEYYSSGKMLFPRMWNGGDQKYIRFYESYTGGKGRVIPDADYKKPSFWANMKFFFDFQLNWMYWRYFMWNFAGRQNDIHSPSPGELFYGNWECGIKFIDNIRLGDQGNAPALLSGNKGKNHYYLLPLLLGVMGIFFQFERDKRGCWLTFLLFFMTGIAIVLYLNQPPYQVRERDYAYAGSFYAFCIWIGLAVMGLYEWIGGKLKDKYPAATAGVFTAACLFVPGLMAQQNWDDHDRSNRRTAVEMARNYLNSVGEQGILITHGDNDTFPLWYAQEVEEVRTDVRICNTSLLGTDWHIGQMKWACNKSKPLDLRVGEEQYLYGTNDAVYIYDTRDQVIPIKAVMEVFKHPDAKLMLESGKSVDYIVSHKISVPVNKENALKYGIVPAEFADLIQDEIILEIPAKKSYITKPELFMLDLLSNYQWDRPIHMLSQGGDINIGLKDYLMYEGFSSKLVPFKNKIGNIDPGIVSVDSLYDKMMNVYSWDALKRDDYYVDYQNYYTFLGVLPQRELFVTTATALLKAGDKERALTILDKCQESLPDNVWPLESIPLGFTTNDYMVVNMVKLYYEAGCPEKATELGGKLGEELLKSAAFYLDFFDYADGEFDTVCQFMSYLIDEMEKGGDKTVSKGLKDRLLALLHSVSGDFEE